MSFIDGINWVLYVVIFYGLPVSLFLVLMAEPIVDRAVSYVTETTYSTGIYYRYRNRLQDVLGAGDLAAWSAILSLVGTVLLFVGSILGCPSEQPPCRYLHAPPMLIVVKWALLVWGGLFVARLVARATRKINGLRVAYNRHLSSLHDAAQGATYKVEE